MLTVHNPFDRSTLAEMPLDGPDRLVNAIGLAQQRFADGQRGAWPTWKRLETLERAATLLETQQDEFARQIALEGGKPWRDAVVEVQRAAQGIRWTASAIRTREGRVLPMDIADRTAGRLAYTRPKPRGPVLAVSAFNHPLNNLIHQAIPALAVGCPVVLKPALKTPLTAFMLATLLGEAGVPDGWLQVVLPTDADVSVLVSAPGWGWFSYIGSERVGFMLQRQLAPGVGCTLELGGAAPTLIEGINEPALLAPSLAKAAYYHAGQVCVSLQRLYVHESLLGYLLPDLQGCTQTNIVGDPLDPTTDVGPMITPEAVIRQADLVADALQHGAQLLAGGERLSETCYAPTLLLDPPSDARVSQQEVFGPILCVCPYSDTDWAIQQANRLPYAFQTAVFCHDTERAFAIADQLKGTTILINDTTAFRADWMPFGGYEQSGYTSGGLLHSIQDYAPEQLTILRAPGC